MDTHQTVRVLFVINKLIKYIQLKLSNDLHRKIKIQAAIAEKTIPEYVLDCVETKLQPQQEDSLLTASFKTPEEDSRIQAYPRGSTFTGTEDGFVLQEELVQISGLPCECEPKEETN